jgi:DNA transformation protein
VAVSPGTRAWALELFEDVGDVTARSMMGGLSLYADGRIFAIVTGDDRIFLKAAGAFAEALAAEGAEQFTYARADRGTAAMGYWSLPEAAADDPEAACEWARRSLAANHPGFP